MPRKMEEHYDLVAEVELVYKIKRPKHYYHQRILTSEDAVIYIGQYCKQANIQLQHVENAGAVYLDGYNRIIGFYWLSKGSLMHTLIDPRSLFQGALRSNAAGIIIWHNHPSGNLTASEKDIKITLQFEKSCKLMGFNFMDHILIIEELGIIKGISI